jgi:rare lipoprotein A
VAAPADAALAAVAPMQAAPADAITVSPLPPPPAGDAITLQVASFSTRDNADRALATLRSAGIQGGQLLDAVANGLPIWRLRVGPVPAAAEAELGARLRGLGFATPQRVHN